MGGRKLLTQATRIGHDSTCGKQQRVAGKKGGNHKSGFSKNDQKEDQIRPGLIITYNIHQMLVNMQGKVNQ